MMNSLNEQNNVIPSDASEMDTEQLVISIETELQKICSSENDIANNLINMAAFLQQQSRIPKKIINHFLSIIVLLLQNFYPSIDLKKLKKKIYNRKYLGKIKKNELVSSVEEPTNLEINNTISTYYKPITNRLNDCYFIVVTQLLIHENSFVNWIQNLNLGAWPLTSELKRIVSTNQSEDGVINLSDFVQIYNQQADVYLRGRGKIDEFYSEPAEFLNILLKIISLETQDIDSIRSLFEVKYNFYDEEIISDQNQFVILTDYHVECCITNGIPVAFEEFKMKSQRCIMQCATYVYDAFQSSILIIVLRSTFLGYASISLNEEFLRYDEYNLFAIILHVSGDIEDDDRNHFLIALNDDHPQWAILNDSLNVEFWNFGELASYYQNNIYGFVYHK